MASSFVENYTKKVGLLSMLISVHMPKSHISCSQGEENDLCAATNLLNFTMSSTAAVILAMEMYGNHYYCLQKVETTVQFLIEHVIGTTQLGYEFITSPQ